MTVEKVTTYGGPNDPFVRMTTSMGDDGKTIDVEIVMRAYLKHIDVTCEFQPMPWYRRALPVRLNAWLSGWIAARTIRRMLQEKL